jgi:hypothetical protein
VEKIDGILEEILDRIRVHHGKRSGQLKRITQTISDDFYSGEVNLTVDDIVPQNPKHFQDLKTLVDENTIVQSDFNRITRKILAAAGGSSTRTHKRISWGLPRPFSATSAILGGDFQTRLREGYNLCANVPVWSGQGIADFVLYVRQRTLPETEKEVSSQGTWRPVMVLDLKSKSSFDLGIVGRELASKTQIVTEEIISKRRSSDEEWETIIKHTPSRKESLQLVSYAKGLVSDYQRLTQYDSDANSHIIQGILVTDDSELPSTIRKRLQGFVVSVYEQIQSELLTQGKTSDTPSVRRHVYEIENSKTRAAIVVKPFKISEDVRVPEALPYPSELPSLHSIKLFENRIPDSRHFVLYVSSNTSGSSESASWIARYWHGMEFARKAFHRRKHNGVVWLDLAGEFTNPKLRRAFVLRHAYNSTLSHKEQNNRRYLREFANKIDFVDLSKMIEEALLNGGEFPSIDYLKDKTQGHEMIIISGMDTLWKILPPDIRGLLQTLTVHLAKASTFGEGTTIWFDSALPTSETSELYKQHRVRLLAHDSPLQTYIDEIILNHHLLPLRGIGESPFADEIRRIVQFSSKGYKDLGLIIIPPLKNWSERFSSEITPERRTTEVYQKGGRSVDLQPVVHEMYTIDDISDILAAHSFCDSDATLNLPQEDSTFVQRYKLYKRELKTPKGRMTYKHVLSRIRLSDDFCDPAIFEEFSKKQGVDFHSLELINSRRKNWTPRLRIKPSETSSLPPHESRLRFDKLTLKEASTTEIVRFTESVALLRKTAKYNFDPIMDFLRNMMERFTKAQKEIGGPDALIADDISNSLKYVSDSKSVWWGLSYLRSNLFEWRFPPAVRKALSHNQNRNPTLMHRYGNYVLMILSYFQDKRGAFGPDQLENLWDAVRPWILMQLGGKQSLGDTPKAVFDMSSVFHDLKLRVECMDRVPPPAIPIFDEVRYGIKVDSNRFDDEKQSGHQWYIFEKTPFSRELIAGCVKSTSGDIESQTIIPLDEQAKMAEQSFSNKLVIPIIIAKTLGNLGLYEPIHDDYYPYHHPNEIDYSELEWRFVGHLRYGTRQSGALARLRWIDTKYYAAFPEMDSKSLPRRFPDTAKDMFGHLDAIATKLSTVKRVNIEVSGQPFKGTIRFFTSNGDECGTLEFDKPSRAVKVLRTPCDLGQPLVINRTLATWDPTQDISFSHSFKQLEQDVLRGAQVQRSSSLLFHK